MSDFEEQWLLAKRELLTRLSDQEHLVRAVFSGRRRNHQPSADRIDVRPVKLKERLMLQMVSTKEGSVDTKNHTFDEFKSLELLDSGFANFLVETTSEGYEVRVGKKGQVFTKSSRVNLVPDYQHDQKKHRMLQESDPFLIAAGISDSSGRIKPSMRDKYLQVEEFLRILESSVRALANQKSELRLVDLGCGHAYLTFAAARYFQLVGREISFVGVDVNANSRRHNEGIARALGIEDKVRFIDSAISSFPVHEVDIAIALHACDTATDDALAWAVSADAHAILAAPCCHHDLHRQMNKNRVAPDGMKQLFEHGILKVRVIDALTDSLRAALLELAGYKAEVFEFISGDHTNRNLMIRAVRSGDLRLMSKSEAGSWTERQAQQLREYRHTCQIWGVKPALESRLRLGDTHDSD